jgi:hypothetical protein
MVVLILIVLLAGLYFQPFLCGMKKRNAVAIFVLNLFLGWTLVGWVAGIGLGIHPGGIQQTFPEVWTCGKCNSEVHAGDGFCPDCAAEIEWDTR